MITVGFAYGTTRSYGLYVLHFGSQDNSRKMRARLPTLRQERF